MSEYQDYLKEISERASEGLHPLPINGAELVNELIAQIKEDNHEYRKDSLHYFIYNVLPGTTAAATVKAAFLKEIILGKYVINEMNSEGIDTSNIELLDEFNTAMVIGVVEKSSERSLFVWPPKNGAHNKYILNNKSKKEILDCDWLHVSGISLRFSPVRETMIEAMKLCKEKNKIVSFDLNLRTELWGFDERFRKVVLEAVSNSSIIFGNLREELFYLFDENEDKLHKNLNDDQVLICRDGENGALGITVRKKVKSDAVSITPFDSVGAGDAFNTGFIYTFSKGLGLEESLNNGNLVAAYKLLGSGARHLPNEQQLEEFKKEYL